MPIIFEKQISPAKKLAVWDINEPIGYFVDKLPSLEIGKRNVKRELEQAASFLLLNILSGEQLHIHLKKDVYGKPYIDGKTTAVSFSHSRNLVACIIDTNGNPVGTDIEYNRNNIGILAVKFVSDRDESPYSGKEHQQFIWGAKEVLYKIYGKKGIDFKKDLHITCASKVEGIILKDKKTNTYELEHFHLGNFTLVWNV